MFDLSFVKSFPNEKPCWKAWVQCPFVSHVKSLVFFYYCPHGTQVPFVTPAELVSKYHKMSPNNGLLCAFCKVSFVTGPEYDKHRGDQHGFCKHHNSCLVSDQCQYLFPSFDEATNHARDKDFPCVPRIRLNMNSTLKICKYES